jgi:uncharacterized membrane protein
MRKATLGLVFGFLACLSAWVLICATAVSAGARTLRIKHFDEQIEVRADGTIDVTEVMEIQFTGAWHGIYRTVPVKYTTPQGFSYTLFLDPLSMTDDSGRKLRYETSSQGRYTKFKIYVPDAEDTARTVIFHYQVLDGLRFLEDHDELYWNVTGDEWDAPIDLVTAHIVLPSGTTGIRAIAYTGAFGSNAHDAKLTIAGEAVDIENTRPLLFHEGLTAVVGFDKGFAHPPSAVTQFFRFVRSNIPLLIPILIFFALLWRWWTHGREPQRLAVAVQYDPPDQLTPAECGSLIDNSADMRDITATLVDLAVKGYLTIDEKDESHLLGLSHTQTFTFHLRKLPAEWTALRPHEQEMLSAIFSAGALTDVNLSDLQNHFYTHLPEIRERIFSALISDGYYLHRPDTTKTAYLGTGLAVGIATVVGASTLSSVVGSSWLTWFLAGILSAVVIGAFGWLMSCRTTSGVRALEKVLGFEEFLSRVEKDQLDRLATRPELFEKYLPYAMALGVEKKWVQAFAGIALQPPQWYSGPYGPAGVYQPLFFVNNLNLMSSNVGSVMTSTPRSAGGSGGSGFGGGGFSGGGFGGGGGGGF